MKLGLRKFLNNWISILSRFAKQFAVTMKVLLSRSTDMITNVWKKVRAALKAKMNAIRNFNFLTFLEPKKISAKEYSLYGVKEECCHFSVLEIQKWSNTKYVSIDDAIKDLDQSWDNFPNKKDIVFPIWGFKNLSPYINGIESLLLQKLPSSLVSHIALLRFERPIELRVLTANQGNITTSIVDVTPNRIIILEGADQILEELQVLGSRFSFPELNANTLSERIRGLLEKEHVKPLGSKLMLGGFGAIFAFELTFIYEKILSANLPANDILALVLFSLSILAYLSYQIVDDSLVAYESPWTTKPYLVSIILFLAFLIGSPFFVTTNFDSGTIINSLRIYSIIFVLICIIKDIGRTYFEKGLSKKVLMIGWLALIAFFIISFAPF